MLLIKGFVARWLVQLECQLSNAVSLTDITASVYLSVETARPSADIRQWIHLATAVCSHLVVCLSVAPAMQMHIHTATELNRTLQFPASVFTAIVQTALGPIHTNVLLCSMRLCKGKR